MSEEKSKMVSLQFHGCDSGYKLRYNSHRRGEILDYPEEKANQLMRDFPGAFTIIGESRKPKEDKKIEKIDERKELAQPENKMIDIAPEDKGGTEKKEFKKAGKVRRRLGKE